MRLQQWARAAQYSRCYTYIYTAANCKCVADGSEQLLPDCNGKQKVQLEVPPYSAATVYVESRVGHVLTRNSRPERLRTWSFLPCHMAADMPCKTAVSTSLYIYLQTAPQIQRLLNTVLLRNRHTLLLHSLFRPF